LNTSQAGWNVQQTQGPAAWNSQRTRRSSTEWFFPGAHVKFALRTVALLSLIGGGLAGTIAILLGLGTMNWMAISFGLMTVTEGVLGWAVLFAADTILENLIALRRNSET
jgi:small-conductance mechanosensitive channel